MSSTHSKSTIMCLHCEKKRARNKLKRHVPADIAEKMFCSPKCAAIWGFMIARKEKTWNNQEGKWEDRE